MKYRIITNLNKVYSFSTFDEMFNFHAQNGGRMYVLETSCIYKIVRTE